MASYYTAAHGGTTSTSNNVWNSWIDTGTATTSSITNAVWSNWTTVSSTSGDVWLSWVDDAGTEHIQKANNVRLHNSRPQPESAEQKAARQAREQEAARVRAEAQRAAEERTKLQAAATKRALQLLRENLSKAQAKEMAKHNFFTVRGGKSGKLYRIHTGRGVAGNIEELAANDNQKAVARYCVHVEYRMDIPAGDNFLAQKLMLEHCEDDLLKAANRTPLAA